MKVQIIVEAQVRNEEEGAKLTAAVMQVADLASGGAAVDYSAAVSVRAIRAALDPKAVRSIAPAERLTVN